jgi:hypothetical protein
MRSIIILIFIFGALYFTNPSFETHKKHFIESEDAQMKDNNSLLGAIGLGRLTGAAGATLLEYHNYHLFSFTKIDGRLATLGLAYLVFRIPQQK